MGSDNARLDVPIDTMLEDQHPTTPVDASGGITGGSTAIEPMEEDADGGSQEVDVVSPHESMEVDDSGRPGSPVEVGLGGEGKCV